MTKRTAAAIALVALLAGGGPALAQSAAPGSLDEFNHWSDGVNRALADHVIVPAATAWRALPAPLPAMGRNAFENLHEPVTVLSRAMASDAPGAVTSAARFAINSTVGLLGVLDVANAIGLPPQRTWFGEGVCKAKIPVGPYVVVPVAGDSTVGVAGTGLLAMAGSTIALGVVSMELAMASVAVDVIATAAALENVADNAGQSLEQRRAAYTAWLTTVGCPTS